MSIGTSILCLVVHEEAQLLLIPSLGNLNNWLVEEEMSPSGFCWKCIGSYSLSCLEKNLWIGLSYYTRYMVQRQ